MLWHRIKIVAMVLLLTLIPAGAVGLTYRAVAGDGHEAGGGSSAAPATGTAKHQDTTGPAGGDRLVVKDQDQEEPPPRPVVQPTPRERFLEMHRTYRKGTGEFMERTYLPAAALSMTRAVKHPKLTEEEARRILTEAIYRSLDDFIDGGGNVVRSERSRLAAAADRQVEHLVGDRDALERFRKWRRTTDQNVNPLGYVFEQPDPIPFQLSAESKRVGWTLEVRGTPAKLQRYKSYFGLEPEVVLHLEKATPARAGQRPFLTLVIFPTERIRDSLIALDAPYVPVRPTTSLPPLHLFWQTASYTVLVGEGPFPQEQAPVAAEFRRFFLGPVLLGPVVARQSPRERFLNMNPDYRKRSGAFYEARYLPSAARIMKQAVDHPRLGEEEAARILKEVIYSFLDAYIDGGGGIMPRAEIARLAARADEQVEKLVQDQSALERFRKWRRTTDHEVNPLCFLLTASDPFPYRLSPRLKDAGWRLEVRGAARQLDPYKGYFGQVPEKILHLENGQVGSAGRRPFLTLVVFRTERLRPSLDGRQQPYTPLAKTGAALPPLNLFWQTNDHTVLAAEGSFRQVQAAAAADFRLFFLGQPRFAGVEVPID
jgi:hypothetical protein